MKTLEPNPLVTIIVTVYKRVEFLQEALESAIAQTCDSYEIIVTDDANSDAAQEICRSVSKPEKIRYRYNQPRLGVALNLRAALLEARGKYIAILNDDDRWEPDFLAHLIEPLEQNPLLVLAFSDHWVMLADGKIDRSETDKNTKIFKRDILSTGELVNTAEIVLHKSVPLVQASVFRATALDPDALVSEVSGAYDFWISCLLAATGKPFYYVSKRLTRYRTHSQMETLRAFPDKFEPEVYIYRNLLANNYFSGFHKWIERDLAYILYRCGRSRLEFGEAIEARELFWESIDLFPDWKPCLRLIIAYLPKMLRVAFSH